MGKTGHSNKGGGVPGDGAFQMKGALYMKNNSTSAFNQQETQDLYGDMSGGYNAMGDSNAPLQKKGKYNASTGEGGSRVGNVLRDITGKRNRDRNNADQDTSNDTKTNAGKIINVLKDVGQSITRGTGGGKHRVDETKSMADQKAYQGLSAENKKKFGDASGDQTRAQVRMANTMNRVERKQTKKDNRSISRGGGALQPDGSWDRKQSDAGKYLSSLGKDLMTRNESQTKSTNQFDGNSGTRLSQPKKSSEKDNNLSEQIPGGLDKNKIGGSDYKPYTFDKKKLGFSMNGPLKMAAVSPTSDVDKKDDKKSDKKDKKKSGGGYEPASFSGNSGTKNA
tara:strand:- start:963 stop:1973 length:1011 start_codon:yes stop_codon:yes gene_type:complete